MNKIEEDEQDDVDEELLEEDKYGRLICRKKKTVYDTGAKLSDNSLKEAFDDENSKLSSEVSNVETESFIGGATKEEAERRIGFHGFVVYYRLPDDQSIPYSLPLMLAYRSANNNNYHFLITKKKHYDWHRKHMRTLYKVDCDHLFGKSQDPCKLNPQFSSIGALIKHYETFAVYDSASGTMETFPIVD